MANRIRHYFGLEVLNEVTAGTFISPTKAICLQTDANMATNEFTNKDCNIMAPTLGASFQFVTDGNSPRSTVSFTHPLPKVMGGLEDVLLAGRFKKAVLKTPDRDEYTVSSAASKTISVRETTLRKKQEFSGGVTDFKISASINDYITLDATIVARRTSETVLAESAPDNVIPSIAVSPLTDALFYSDSNPITINGTPARVKNFDFAPSPKFVDVENDTDGKMRELVDFTPVLTLKADSATDMRFKTSDMVAGTEFNIRIPFSDNLGVEKGYILLPRCVLNTDPKITNNSGMEEVEATYSIRSANDADDGIYIAIYA